MNELVESFPATDRVSRVVAVFTFVSHLVDVPRADEGPVSDPVDLLLRLAGDREGPAILLSALLMALGEHAALEHAPEATVVRVELEVEDLARVPPHARVLWRNARPWLPLDPRRARSPLGFVPQPVRAVLEGAAQALSPQ